MCLHIYIYPLCLHTQCLRLGSEWRVFCGFSAPNRNEFLVENRIGATRSLFINPLTLGECSLTKDLWAYGLTKQHSTTNWSHKSWDVWLRTSWGPSTRTWIPIVIQPYNQATKTKRNAMFQANHAWVLEDLEGTRLYLLNLFRCQVPTSLLQGPRPILCFPSVTFCLVDQNDHIWCWVITAQVDQSLKNHQSIKAIDISTFVALR